MNRVQASRDARIERGCRLDQLVVDLHEVEPLKEPAGPGLRGRTVAPDRAENLHPCEGTGRPIGLTSEILAKCTRLGFRDDELHERGRVQIHQCAYRSWDRDRLRAALGRLRPGWALRGAPRSSKSAAGGITRPRRMRRSR